jgi:hypothetical protein
MNIEEIIKKKTYSIQTELGLSNRERKVIEFQIKELIKQLTLNGVGCSLKDKKAITFDEYLDFIYTEKRGKYINKETDYPMSLEEIEQRYEWHLKNL